jgi:iron only hydrogenase large subunit-like protein
MKNNPNIPYNFFEGMICKGGCINGPLSLKRNDQMSSYIDKFSAKAKTKDPTETANAYK